MKTLIELPLTLLTLLVLLTLLLLVLTTPGVCLDYGIRCLINKQYMNSVVLLGSSILLSFKLARAIYL